MVEGTTQDRELIFRLREALQSDDAAIASDLLEDLRVPELIQSWDELEAEERLRLLGLLPPEEAAELVANIPEELPGLLETLPEQTARNLLEQLEPDDLADAMQIVEAEAPERAELLRSLIDPAARAIAEALAVYEEDEAGGLMTPEFISLRAIMTVEQALAFLRRASPAAETIYYLYVVDQDGRLRGVLSLRELIVAPPGTRVEQIMDSDVVNITTDTDQEHVAQIMSDYDLSVLPVVDAEHRLVGIITVDDVLDVVESEATEDIHRLGAAPIDIDYARARPWLLFRKRASWLVLLVVSMTLTFNVISHYEAIIAEVVVLAALIPLLIGTGGNVGAQVSTLVVRALATRDLELRDYLRVFVKECATGLLLGLAFGLFMAGYIMIFRAEPRIALALGITMALISLTANLVGASLPFLFRRLGIDPALTSSPVITTIMDVVGLLIYFRTVIWILGPILSDG